MLAWNDLAVTYLIVSRLEHVRIGRFWSEAEEALSRVIELDAKQEWAYRRRAFVRSRHTDQIDKALEDELAALTLKFETDYPEPDFAEAASYKSQRQQLHYWYGVLYAENRQYAEAFRCFGESAVDAEGTYSQRSQMAVLAAAIGDLENYRAICLRMLELYAESKSFNEISTSAWSCALVPGALDDLMPAIQLIERVKKSSKSPQRYHSYLGALLLRAGQYQEAKTELEASQSANLEPWMSGAVEYLVAICEWRLGHEELAREHLQKAKEMVDSQYGDPPAWDQNVMKELLRREAEELIQ